MASPAPDGRWNPTAQRRAATGWAGRSVWHVLRDRGASLMFGNVALAVTRKQGPAGARWFLRIEGFEWQVTPDMPTARFRTLGGALAIPYTPVKAFPTLRAAQQEAEAIIAAAAKES